MNDLQSTLAGLPQVDVVLRHPSAATPVERFGRARVADAVRTVLDQARETIQAGDEVPDVPAVLEAATARLKDDAAPAIRRVVNATGVVLHTNLGRAPLSAVTREQVGEAAGYATVEYDLVTGERGSRTGYVGELAAEACGTPAATVVNNGAAALFLVLAALGAGREVIVSRGELIEIGGSYRLPDVMAASGAHMIEVGTTNRTRAADYRAAATEDTALLVKVHQSNYRVVGFTGAPNVTELAEVAGDLGVPLVYDVGSGLLRGVRDGPLAGEPSVRAAVADGADLVLFSGDKLLGGPQAGIIAGRSDLVEACRRHPLARAVRIDKLQRAALEATLQAHLRTDPEPPVELPVWAMLNAGLERLKDRAHELARQIGSQARAQPTTAVVGGGAVPGAGLDSWGVVLVCDDSEAVATTLRHQRLPVIGLVGPEGVTLDLRTVAPADDSHLADAALAALVEEEPAPQSDQ